MTAPKRKWASFKRKCFGLKEHAKVNKQSFDVELSKQYEKE